MNEAETSDRKSIIREGLERFLEESGLDFTNKRQGQIIDRLFFYFCDHKSISASLIHSYLADTYDYVEHSRHSLDSATYSDAIEDALFSIMTAAETKPQKVNPYMKQAVFLIFALLTVAGCYFAINEPLSRPITTEQAELLKDKVASIVEAEIRNNNNTSHTAVWNRLKQDKKHHKTRLSKQL